MIHFPRTTSFKDGFLPPDAVSASVRGNLATCASAWVALLFLAKRALSTASRMANRSVLNPATVA